MANIPLSELAPEVLATAPTCPTPTVVRALRTAARNLCEEAVCYRYDIGNVVVPANVNQISLDVPANTVMQRAVSLTLDSQPLLFSSPTLLDDMSPNWRTDLGRPRYFYRASDDMNDIIIVPRPAVTYATVGIRGIVAVKPSRTATEIDEVFLDQFQDIIVDGALAALLVVRSAPWYDPNLAVFHKNTYDNSVLDAKARAESDDTYKGKLINYGGL